MVFLLRYGHKNTVVSVKWNSNGNWVLTASRDQTIKVSFRMTHSWSCFVLVSTLVVMKASWQSSVVLFLMILFVLTAVRYMHFEGIGVLLRPSEGSHMYAIFLKKACCSPYFRIHANCPCTSSETLSYSRLTDICLCLEYSAGLASISRGPFCQWKLWWQHHPLACRVRSKSSTFETSAYSQF